MNILITGANGFVGVPFVEEAKKNNTVQTLSLRTNEWHNTSFNTIDTIVHLAGKAHDMTASNGDEYYKINVSLTEQLVKKAIEDNVKHFIYISSIKVYGDTVSEVITETSPYNPTDDYGKSKMQAEQMLLTYRDKIIISIVRPPLIYGKGVKGNMKKIVELCKKNSFLPFGNMNNKRSMVYVENLIQLILTIASQKKSGIFLASDGDAISTETLVQTIKDAMGYTHKLIAIPQPIRYVIKILKPSLYTRLFGSYVLNNSYTCKTLNYTPSYSFAEGVKKMIED